MDPIYWLRGLKVFKTSCSTIWKSLVKSLPIISNNLSWEVGRRFQIYLGIDPICGLGDKYPLSQNLVQEIHKKKNQVLKDIHLVSGNNIWQNAKVLGLVGCLAEEWDRYISNLYQGNISLSSNLDKLVWAFNAREG